TPPAVERGRAQRTSPVVERGRAPARPRRNAPNHRTTAHRVSSRSARSTGAPSARTPSDHGVDATLDEGRALGVTPALDALLPLERVLDARKFVRPDERHRQPAPGVRGTVLAVVLLQTEREVLRAADI